MSAPPRLPIHVGDYLKDTPPFSAVTWEHHGIYFAALIITWNVPGVRLPVEAAWLSLRFGCTVEELELRVRPVLETYFKRRGNFYYQKRLSEVYSFVANTSEKQSARAKSMWDKKKRESRGSATAEAPAMQTLQCLPNTQIPNTKSQKKDSSSKSLKGDFDGYWDVCPKKVGKGAAFKAYAKARTKTDHQTLCDAMRRYAATRVGEDAQFTAHPATWLNAERWLDQAGASGAATLGLQLTDDEKREEQETLKRLGVV